MSRRSLRAASLLLAALWTLALAAACGRPRRVEARRAPVAPRSGMSPDDLAAVGRRIFYGKGLCSTCHTIGGRPPGPQRFPDLSGIAWRAATRVPGMEAEDYLAQSLYEPNAVVAPGFKAGMPPIARPPIALTDAEIRAVIAFLESLGGRPTMTLERKLGYPRGAGVQPAKSPPRAYP